jgi:hypothetical protein
MCEAIFSVPVSVLQILLELKPTLYPWGWICLMNLIVVPFMVTEDSLHASVLYLEPFESKIWGVHGGYYEEYSLLGCDLKMEATRSSETSALTRCTRHRVPEDGILRTKQIFIITPSFSKKKKLHGMSPRANYTDRATAACRRRDCQLLRIEGATWSAWRIPTAVFSVF